MLTDQTIAKETDRVIEVHEHWVPGDLWYRFAYEEAEGTIIVGRFATVAHCGREAKIRCGDKPWVILNARDERVHDSVEHAKYVDTLMGQSRHRLNHIACDNGNPHCKAIDHALCGNNTSEG